MKLLPVIVIACCAVIARSSDESKSRSEGKPQSQADLLERASAQLERLAPYRRLAEPPSTVATSPQLTSSDSKNSNSDQNFVNLEIYEVLPEDVQRDIVKKLRENPALLESLMDPQYMAMMQERIKRSGYDGYGGDSYGAEEWSGAGYGHGGYSDGGGHDTDSGSGGIASGSGGIISGSSSIIGGIASGILGGIASASAGASKGAFTGSASSSASTSSSSSSHKHKPVYGTYEHPYSHEEKDFNAWDFKKAIFNTVIQAVKAISGGVIALKGQLIKGSGYLVSTKGRIISSTGEAISSLGRNIAKSAIIAKNPPHPGYLYDHPPEPHDEHDNAYEGPPPPSENEYPGHDDYSSGNSHYGSPSDDGDDHAGLLIVKPTKPEYNYHDHPPVDLDPRKPHSSHPEVEYGPPPKESHENHVDSHGPTYTYDHYNENQENHVDSYQFTQPPTSYDAPNHYPTDDKTKQHYPLYPPLQSDSNNLGNNLAVQHSVEYPPIHIQQFEYSLPDKKSPIGNFNHGNPEKDVSVYSSLSIGLNPQLNSLKISSFNHQNEFELPQTKPALNFHSLPMSGPLKIPILNPFPVNYWYGNGYMQPMSGYSLHRRSSSQKRRRLSDNSTKNPMLVNKKNIRSRV